MIRTLLSWTSNILVLGTLAGVAVWGHETDWTFVHFVHHGHSEAAPHASLTVEPARPVSSKVVTIADQESAGILGIATGQVSERTLPETLSVHGQVTYVPARLAQLSARVPGIVWNVAKEVGDPVHEGEILAILDAVEVGQAKAEFLQTLVEAELQKRNLERIEAAPDSVPERVRRETIAAHRQARVACYNAQQKLINLGLPIRIQDLDGLTDEARAFRIRFLGLPPEFIASRDPESVTANLIPLKASFDGVVIRRDITEGEVVTPDQPQIAIADLSSMWIQLEVHKEDSSRIRTGQTVEFSADGLPATLRTTLTWISTEVDLKTRTVRAIAEVENPLLEASSSGEGKRLLEANLFGTGTIRLRDKPNATVIPRSAVIWNGKQHVAFVPVANAQPDGSLQYEPRPIQTGIVTDDGFVEIVTGLDTGDTVVVSGADLLKSELLLRELRGEAEVARQP